MTRDLCAFPAVEYRPTAHGARAAQCALGVLWASAGRAPPHAVDRGPTAPIPRQVTCTEIYNHRYRKPWRAALALFATCSIGRPPTEHARRAVRTWRDCVVGQHKARSPRCRPGSTAPTPRQFDGTVFKGLYWSFSNHVERGPRAFRHVECRPTAHGAHTPRSAGLGWFRCGAPTHAVGRGSTAPTP